MSTNHEKVLESFVKRLDKKAPTAPLNLPERRSLKELDDIWDELSDFGSEPEILELREDALHDYNSQPPAAGSLRGISCPPTKNKKYWGISAVAASFIVVLSMTTWWQMSTNPEITHITAIGELKRIELEDGSLIHLDAQTRLKQTFSAEKRTIELLQGRAKFDVAHDANRPFSVLAGNGQVTALGTIFVVSREHTDVEVTLLKGKVSVENTKMQMRYSSDNADIQTPIELSPVILTPGQQAIYTASSQPRSIESVNIEKATSWQEGRLIFEDNELEQVLEQLNRYSARKIILGSPSLSSLRVTGVFKTGHHSSAIAAFEAFFPLKAIENNSGTIILLASNE